MTLRRGLLSVAVLVFLAGTVALVWTSRERTGYGELEGRLSHRGLLARVGDVPASAGEGTEIREARDIEGLGGVLRSSDLDALAPLMEARGVEGLLVGRRMDRGKSVGARLGAYAHVPGLVGDYLVPAAALYMRNEVPALDEGLGATLAEVARGILEGRAPPRVSSFPESLRRVRSAEVMVLLRQGTRPRLWRSARGSSVGRALVTACGVARERWHEREPTMGGPLLEKLPRLDVEVSLLVEDGTIGVATPAFIDRVIGPMHGIGYERKGAWRYLLPAATKKAGGGHRALGQLLKENGLTREAAHRPDVRLYRFVVRKVGVSPARR